MKRPGLYIAILFFTILCSTVLVSTIVSGIFASMSPKTEKNEQVKATQKTNDAVKFASTQL